MESPLLATWIVSPTYAGVLIIDPMECSFLVSRRVPPSTDYCSAIVSSMSSVHHYKCVLFVLEELIASIDRIKFLGGVSLDITI